MLLCDISVISFTVLIFHDMTWCFILDKRKLDVDYQQRKVTKNAFFYSNLEALSKLFFAFQNEMYRLS